MRVATIVFCLCSSGVAACSTTREMTTGMNTLVGQPLTAAFQQLGFPQTQTKIADQSVYTWQEGHTFSMPMSRALEQDMMPMACQVSGPSMSYLSSVSACTVRAIVDPKTNLIKSVDWHDESGGCDRYAHRFGREKAAAQTPPAGDGPHPQG